MDTNKIERKEMDEYTFWIRVVLIICATICIFTGAIVSCVSYEKKLVADMTKNGANPIEASCALGSQSFACQLYFADKK